jgi:actin-related protein
MKLNTGHARCTTPIPLLNPTRRFIMKKVKEQVQDINIDDIDIEAVDIIEDEVQVVQDDKKVSKAADVIAALKSSAPQYDVIDGLTPSLLDSLFNLNDGGRTIRRYLRKYFAERHIKKESWKLSKQEACEVIAFLSTKYGEPNFNAIKKDEAQA